jgi:hypothetical protein
MASTPITAADYRGETVAGKKWRRAHRVVIDNPYGGPASVSLDEQEITSIDGFPTTAKATETLTTMVDLATVVPLYDPTTGEAIPGASTTHLDVYVALYSLYRQLGAARDART